MIHGAWSYTWQGADEAAYPDRLQTVRMALNQNFDVVDAEVDCDAVVVCIGEHPSVEKPGDIDELNLAADQQTIIAEAIETGKPVILVFFCRATENAFWHTRVRFCSLLGGTARTVFRASLVSYTFWSNFPLWSTAF